MDIYLFSFLELISSEAISLNTLPLAPLFRLDMVYLKGFVYFLEDSDPVFDCPVLLGVALEFCAVDSSSVKSKALQSIVLRSSI